MGKTNTKFLNCFFFYLFYFWNVFEWFHIGKFNNILFGMEIDCMNIAGNRGSTSGYST